MSAFVSRAVMGASRWLDASNPFGIKATPTERIITIDTRTAAAINTRRFLMVCPLSMNLDVRWLNERQKRDRPNKSEPRTSPREGSNAAGRKQQPAAR